MFDARLQRRCIVVTGVAQGIDETMVRRLAEGRVSW